MTVSNSKTNPGMQRMPEFKGFQSFCNKTSMHGFAELYSSYTVFWKLFWISVCIGACAITFYQVYQSVNEYINEPTTITILSVPEEEMFYVPFRLCYWQWFYWVDWNKVVANGYDKDVLLFSFSFFGSMFMENTSFSYNSSAKKFDDTMSSMNFTRMSQFYNSVARSVPIKNGRDGKIFSTYFDETEILYNPNTYNVMFCYKISQSSFYKYFMTNKKDKTISFETLDESYSNVKHLLTEAEYTQYILQWVDIQALYTIDRHQSINVSSFAPPITLMLFNNKAKGLEISTDNDQYIVDVRASVFTWLSKPGSHCSNEFPSVSGNQSCEELCTAIVVSNKACDCIYLDEAFLLKNDTDDFDICNRDINFVTSYSIENVTVKKYVQKQSQGCNWTALTPAVNACMQDRCVPACQTWNYEKSITIKSTSASLKKYGRKNTTKVFIQYPKGEDVIIMTETDAQSWETFVGNVGGILGIWTGASIVSFIQLIYLCFFADSEDECTRFFAYWFQKAKRIATWKNEDVQHVHIINTDQRSALRQRPLER